MSALTVLAVSSEPLLRAIAAEPGASSKRLAEVSGKKINNIARDLDVLANAGLIVRHPPTLCGGGRDALEAIDRAAAGPMPAAVDGVAEIRLELIDQDPALNPRKHFDEEDLAGLAASIAEKGVLQPILLRQGLVEGRFRIVAGERRWRGSVQAGRPTIPAIVRQMDDVEALEVALIENVQRTDLTPLEEARGYEAIIAARQARDPQVSFRDAKQVIADATKRTVRHVEQRLSLLRLSDADQDQLERGEISIEIARNRASAAAAPETQKSHLNPDQLFLLAEIADFVANGKGLRAGKQASVGWPIRNDRVVAQLVQLGLVARWTDYDSRVETIQFKDRGLKVLDELAPAFASRREPTMEKLRQAARRWPSQALEHAYATEWLNPPFDPHPDEVARLETAKRNEAEREEQRRLRERREAETRELLGAKGVAMLAAVRAFEANAPTGRADFHAAFAALLKDLEATAPWSLVLEHDGPQLRDADGRPNTGAGPSLEARRRLIALAINFAAGCKAWSGEELATDWSTDLRLGRRVGDVVRIAGGATYEIVEVLGGGNRTYLAQQLRGDRLHGKPAQLMPAAIEALVRSAGDWEDSDEEPAEEPSGPPAAVPIELTPRAKEALSYAGAEDVLRAVEKYPNNGLTALESAVGLKLRATAIGRRLDGLAAAGLINQPRAAQITEAGRAALLALAGAAETKPTGPLAAMRSDQFAQDLRTVAAEAQS